MKYNKPLLDFFWINAINNDLTLTTIKWPQEILDHVSIVCNPLHLQFWLTFYNNSWEFVEWEPIFTFQCYLFIILLSVIWVKVQLSNFIKLTSDLRNTSCWRGKCWREVFIAEVFIFTAESTGFTGRGVTRQTFKDLPMWDLQTTFLQLCGTSGNKPQYKNILLIQTFDFSVNTSRVISLIHLPLYMFLVRSLTTKLQSHHASNQQFTFMF